MKLTFQKIGFTIRLIKILLLGKFDGALIDGSLNSILSVNTIDFNWQTNYFVSVSMFKHY